MATPNIMPSHQSVSTMATPNIMSTQSSPVMPKSHVGFDSITTQIERKLLKRGFQFNIICVGRFKPMKNFLHPGSHCCRPDRSWEIDPDKYHLCLSSHRLQGPPYPIRSSSVNHRNTSGVARYVLWYGKGERLLKYGKSY